MLQESGGASNRFVKGVSCEVAEALAHVDKGALTESRVG